MYVEERTFTIGNKLVLNLIFLTKNEYSYRQLVDVVIASLKYIHGI